MTFTVSSKNARISSPNCPFWKIFRHDCSCSRYRTLAESDARANKRFRANPCIIANGDGLRYKLHRGIIVIVRSAAEIGALGDNRAQAQFDLVHRIQSCIVANPALIVNLQVPRRPDLRLRIHMHLITNLCAKQPQDSRSPTVRNPGRRPEQQGIHHTPHQTLQTIGNRESRTRTISSFNKKIRHKISVRDACPVRQCTKKQ